MRLGIFGGTFNPIHLGHLLLAETARETLRLDRVLFIPTHQPPHKAPPDLLDGRTRLTLIKLAVRDHPAFRASDLELRRGGVSYTVDTVRAVRRAHPRARLFLLLGQDLLRVQWKGWDELARRCRIVVAARETRAPPHPARNVTWLRMPRMEVASSEIRSRLRRGRSIRYLVPRAVERFAQRHRLYRRSPRGATASADHQPPEGLRT